MEARATHLPEKVALSGEPYFTFPLPYCNLFHLKEKRKAATTDTEKRRKQQHRKGRGGTTTSLCNASPLLHLTLNGFNVIHVVAGISTTTPRRRKTAPPKRSMGGRREKRKEEEEGKAAPPRGGGKSSTTQRRREEKEKVGTDQIAPHQRWMGQQHPPKQHHPKGKREKKQHSPHGRGRTTTALYFTALQFDDIRFVQLHHLIEFNFVNKGNGTTTQR